MQHAHAESVSFDEVFVVRCRSRRWEVAHNGIIRPLVDWFFSEERALEHAFEMAEQMMSVPGTARILVRVESAEPFERILVKEARSEHRVQHIRRAS